MKASRRRIRHAFLLTAASATAAAMIVAGVASSALAGQPTSHARSTTITGGPGYPPPGGIYAPFTNCPLRNPLMQESTPSDATGCVAGDAINGSIKIGNIVTPIAHPVTAQFGLWDPPGATPNQFTGGVLPPLNGKQLVTSPEVVPGGLLKALGCPSSIPAVENLCREAAKLAGKYLQLTALAQTAGPITNFGLTTWTQPIKIQLINPLLGTNCYIGSTDNPIVINPQLTGTLSIEPDPNPARFPQVVVFKISNAVATDNTFTAPVVQGCGPGGSANIAVDTAIDTSDGLPSASGSNSLTLNGTFYLADSYGPQNQASTLLAAFKASVGASAPAGGRKIPASSLRHAGRYGIR